MSRMDVLELARCNDGFGFRIDLIFFETLAKLLHFPLRFRFRYTAS